MLQAIGGGIATACTTYSTVQMGIHIMIAELSFQAFSILVFAVLCTEFALSVKYHPEERNWADGVVHNNVRFGAFLGGM